MTRSKMRADAMQQPHESVACPYCGKPTTVVLPADYAPVYRACGVCGRRFIIERTRGGLDVFTLEAAPCCSNPDCRAAETAQGQEE
jgi:transcription elongation factor Elf1